MNIQSNLAPYLEFCKYRKELDYNTLKAYKTDLWQYFAYTNTSAPQRQQIEDYITHLHKQYKAQNRKKRKIASIKAFYNYLEESEIITENPFHKIKVKFKESVTLPRIIPREEIEQLLNHIYKCLEQSTASDYKYILRDAAVIELFFATGARVYEVSNIKEENINLNTGLIRLMGKGNKERYVQISNPSVLAILKKYYKKNKQRSKTAAFSL